MNKLSLISYSILLSLLTISCNDKSSKKLSLEDSLRRDHMADSMVRNDIAKMTHDALFEDTIGIENAPVKVLSAKPTEREYSRYKDIKLTYKNVSGKDISAIRFRWYGLNAFGEPADLAGNGFGAGFTDNILKSGQSSTSTWDVLSKDLKTVVKAWPIEVAFQDGTKWKSKP